MSADCGGSGRFTPVDREQLSMKPRRRSLAANDTPNRLREKAVDRHSNLFELRLRMKPPYLGIFAKPG